MPEIKRSTFWIRVVAITAVVALFVADFGFGIMAKPVPYWAYAVPGLLALGIEAPAVARLVMQALRAFAGVPPSDGNKG
ncbi:hypothetical protein [Shimia sediminis]|uniref:hypothetical protein n=1 Tax=Shimia sediminis TaxID=2497945 RepID=UPI000F8D5C0D|nr:hypothetical protein [Shimia sediminis]